MKTNLTPYSYPFQKVFDFLETDIDKKLQSFYSSFKNEFFAFRIKDINEDKNEIQFYKDCYNDGEIEYETYTFENEIKFHFSNLIYKSFDVIADGINICFISNQSIPNYLDRLDRQYDFLLSHSRNKQFPYLIKYLNLIRQELNHYKVLDNINEYNQNLKDSPFKPHDNIRRAFFSSLFAICIFHELIDESFSQEDFIDVFTSQSTTKNIVFTCNNQLAVSLFEGSKPLFDNMSTSSIAKSKRFFTKQKTLLSTTNYESSKNRIKLNFKIIELNKDLEELTSDYK